MISRIRHLLFDNIGYKLASLLIAILMWYGVTHDPVAEISFRVPIEFSQPPKDLDYVSDVVPQAQILLRGPARLLRDLHPENVRAIIDLRDATAGEHTYDLTANQIRVPHDVQVMQVTPSRVRLVFDQPETRQVAVKARIVGALPPGYRVTTVVCNPATLSISGPAHHVNAVENALSDPVDVTGTTGETTFDTTAYLPDPLVHITGSDLIHVSVRTQKSYSKAGVP